MASMLRAFSLLRAVADDLGGFCGGWSPSLVSFDSWLAVSCKSWHYFGTVLLSLGVHRITNHVAKVLVSLLQVIDDLIKPVIFFNDLWLRKLLFLYVLQIGLNLVLLLPKHTLKLSILEHCVIIFVFNSLIFFGKPINFLDVLIFLSKHIFYLRLLICNEFI